MRSWLLRGLLFAVGMVVVRLVQGTLINMYETKAGLISIVLVVLFGIAAFVWGLFDAPEAGLRLLGDVRGQAVAEIPDMATLEVQAMLPEAEFRHLAKDDSVRVRVDGSGQRLPGTVVELGRVVRSKSRLQPVPVIDVRVRIDGKTEGLRPGQAVRVEVSDG